MTKYKLEYIWLDGYTPTPNLRGKTQIKEFETSRRSNSSRSGASTARRPCRPKAAVVGLRAEAGRDLSGSGPHQRRAGHVRSHDAGRRHAACRRTSAPPSSTMRAPGSASSRNTSSTRTAVRSASRKPAIRRRRAPTTPASATRTSATIARKIVEEHLDLCLAAGINHEGINAEVAKGQWEFQIFGKGSKKAADEIWMARYLLLRLTREIRHRHRVALQAARRHRLERLGHARQLLDRVHARQSAARSTSRR